MYLEVFIPALKKKIIHEAACPKVLLKGVSLFIIGV
jgi:hypothetical protein